MDGSIPSPALPAWVPRRALDVTAYHAMAAAGILRPEDRVELIEGELIWMNPLVGPHIGCVMALTRMLVRAVGDAAEVSVQGAVRLDPHNEPQPDVAVLRPRADGYRGGQPPLAEDALLLVEVADSSLRVDREVKAPLYARAGVPEYWIVDLVNRTVLVHHDPGPQGYAAVAPARAGEHLTPLRLPGAGLGVADILGPE